jgi:hypothetical protein
MTKRQELIEELSKYMTKADAEYAADALLKIFA